MIIPSISKTVARRYILGRQGLWPGRRWAGQPGAAQALHDVECVQMDPLNVVARSHHIALWGRVLDYKPEHLDTLMYRERKFFDYGGNLRIYPMRELRYWRVTMRRKGKEARWADFARRYRTLLKTVKTELRARGPLGNRDFAGQSRVNSYRGRKDSAIALYYLWLTGEVMVHHRAGFERVYDFRQNVAPASLDRKATVQEAERYFARKAFAFRGLCTAKRWASLTSFFVERKIDKTEAQRRLDRLLATGEITRVELEGEKEPHYLLAEDTDVLMTVNAGRVPDAWRPLDTTTQEEAVFLAPLDPVIGDGRAKSLFDFDYLWEVYKPAAKRRWGYYTLPILYGDQLAARLDSKLERESGRLIINGFWLEDERTGKDAGFAEALARGLARLARFVEADRIDVSAVKPAALRRHIQARVKALAC